MFENELYVCSHEFSSERGKEGVALKNNCVWDLPFFDDCQKHSAPPPSHPPKKKMEVTEKAYIYTLTVCILRTRWRMVSRS